MLETLLSAAGGGLFGLIGSAFTKFMGYREKKLEYKYLIDMAEQERLNLAAELELAKVKGEIELELAEVTTDAENLQAAIIAEGSIRDTSQWVQDLRGSLRPFLTYSLVILAVSIAWAEPANPYIHEIIFLATVAVTFWFGSRPPAKR
jgi:hypothetical protein